MDIKLVLKIPLQISPNSAICLLIKHEKETSTTSATSATSTTSTSIYIIKIIKSNNSNNNNNNSINKINKKNNTNTNTNTYSIFVASTGYKPSISGQGSVPDSQIMARPKAVKELKANLGRGAFSSKVLWNPVSHVNMNIYIYIYMYVYIYI